MSVGAVERDGDTTECGHLRVEEGAAAGVGDVDAIRPHQIRHAAQVELATVCGGNTQPPVWLSVVNPETSSTLPEPSASKVVPSDE